MTCHRFVSTNKSPLHSLILFEFFFIEFFIHSGFTPAQALSHPYGHPVSIQITNTEKNEITLNTTALDEIFLHSEVKDRKIVIVSIIGAFRKGKSFFMDYCLRFMYGNVSFSYNFISSYVGF